MQFKRWLNQINLSNESDKKNEKKKIKQKNNEQLSTYC